MHLLKRGGTLLLLTALTLSAPRSRAQDPGTWVGSWNTAMIHSPFEVNALSDTQQQAPTLTDVTIRQMLRVGADGSRLRIRLANTFGTRPLILDAVSIGRQAAAGRGNLEPASLQVMHFNGHARVTMAPGATIYSDPLHFNVHANDMLGVSIHVAEATAPSTWHMDPVQDNYLSIRGNHTASATMPVGATMASTLWLSGVEVAAEKIPTSAIVALGDSITNGLRSTVNANRRYPDVLAERLRNADRTGRCRHTVLNAGIDGNQVTTTDGAFGPGESMLKRFDRDVLAQHGVRFVIVLGGINDIGETTMVARKQGRSIDGDVLATHVIDGLQAIVSKAHAAGLRIYGATILPFAGTAQAYSAQGEQAREKVNDWIRHRAAYDAVIDFDQATRDPARPQHLRAELDSGDHLHPNDNGYRAMAASIPLRLFDCAASTTHSPSPSAQP